MTDAIKALLPAILDRLAPTSATDLPAHSTDASPPQTRLNDRQLAKVKMIAETPLASLPSCDDGHFVKCMRMMQAVLPRQRSDDTSGELMARVYQRQLGQYPKEAISHLADKATMRCQWFPTIKECLDILAEWKRDDPTAREWHGANAAFRNEMQARMEDAFAAMKAGTINQDEIDALSDRWKRIAVEHGHLRCVDGAYSLRRAFMQEGGE